MATATDLVVRARTRLLIQQPFFGALALRLRLVETESCKTMATDGQELRFNPKFVSECSHDELMGTIAHEVMHCALQHPFRRGDRDPKRWNIAADHVVNPIIMDAGFVLPKGATITDRTHAGKSVEEAYRDLGQDEQPPQQQPNPQPQGKQKPQNSQQPGAAGQGQQPEDFGIGEVFDPTDETGKPLEAPAQADKAAEWKIAAEQAAQTAKVAGLLPGGAKRMLEQIRESRVDWRAVLRRFLAQTVVSDYSWSRPNRRFIGQGLYLPSTSKEGCGELVIAIDTSGSLSAAELAEFAAEVQSIADDVKPEAIHVIYCDAQINDTRTFRQFEPLELEMQGGGGTDFRPPFQWVESEGIRPKAMLYLTDLCCYSYPDEPDFPVLWVTQSRDTAPWGETVRMEPEAA